MIKMEKNSKKTPNKKPVKKVVAATKDCDDKNCHVHGNLKIRTKSFVGTVVSDKMRRTVTISWGQIKKIPKYERVEKRKTVVYAHNPPCINAKKGDKVVINETRPLSKIKRFVVTKVIGEDLDFSLKEQTADGYERKQLFFFFQLFHILEFF